MNNMNISRIGERMVRPLMSGVFRAPLVLQYLSTAELAVARTELTSAPACPG